MVIAGKKLAFHGSGRCKILRVFLFQEEGKGQNLMNIGHKLQGPRRQFLRGRTVQLALGFTVRPYHSFAQHHGYSGAVKKLTQAKEW